MIRGASAVRTEETLVDARGDPRPCSALQELDLKLLEYEKHQTALPASSSTRSRLRSLVRASAEGEGRDRAGSSPRNQHRHFETELDGEQRPLQETPDAADGGSQPDRVRSVSERNGIAQGARGFPGGVGAEVDRASGRREGLGCPRCPRCSTSRRRSRRPKPRPSSTTKTAELKRIHDEASQLCAPHIEKISPNQSLSYYKRLRRAGKKPFVAVVRRGACSGCGFRHPAQRLQEIKQGPSKMMTSASSVAGSRFGASKSRRRSASSRRDAPVPPCLSPAARQSCSKECSSGVRVARRTGSRRFGDPASASKWREYLAAGLGKAQTPAARIAPRRRNLPPSTCSTRAPRRVYSDGASRGNPGPAAVGIRFWTPKRRGACRRGSLDRSGPRTTSRSTAGPSHALEKASGNSGWSEVELRMDSELVVKQINGQYRVKEPTLAGLKAQVDALLAGFRTLERPARAPRAQNRRDGSARERGSRQGLTGSLPPSCPPGPSLRPPVQTVRTGLRSPGNWYLEWMTGRSRWSRPFRGTRKVRAPWGRVLANGQSR